MEGQSELLVGKEMVMAKEKEKVVRHQFLFWKMYDLVEFVKESYIEIVQGTGFNEDIHHGLITMTADRYELFDEEDMFPIWLIRVVEGVIRDVDEEHVL